jgi:ribA/ribD-fused uncharacterized protein
MIKQFQDEYRFLSNFFACDILYRGITFPSAEHAFQAVKAKYSEEMTWVAEAATPGIAKRRGRQVTIRDDWDSVRVDEMYRICYIKFSQPYLTQALLDTHPHELIEGNYWHDQFWGNCACETHADIEGRNYLGRILMHIRNSYR